MVLLAPEDDRPDVAVEEADNNWLWLVGRARKDMRSLQELLDSGDLANNLVSQSTLENREEMMLASTVSCNLFVFLMNCSGFTYRRTVLFLLEVWSLIKRQ